MAFTQTLEKVTPAMAERWLNANTGNRSMRHGVAERYSADMKAGKWTQCTAPIAFYDNDELADGQHRLFAVVESGTTQTFIILRGLDRVSGLNIDTGLGRTLVDNGRISGLDTNLSHTLIATARAVQSGEATRRGGTESNAQKLLVVDEHREACQWAVSNMPDTKNIKNSAVLGAVARAWYWEQDKDRLAEFCRVVATGFSEGHGDSAAVAMRNYLIQHAGLASGSSMWRDTFLKVMNAIQYFMKRQKLTYIKSVKDEAYPLKKKRQLKKAV